MYATNLPLSIQGAATTIGVTTVSASTALPSGCAGFQLELNNLGNTPIYVQIGTGAQTATVAAGYPILSGQTKVVTVPFSATQIGAIHNGTGTQNLIIVPAVGS